MKTTGIFCVIALSSSACPLPDFFSFALPPIITIPSTCFSRNMSKYRDSTPVRFILLSFIELHKIIVYPRLNAFFSASRNTPEKNGFVISGTIKPIVFVALFIRLLARALGLKSFSFIIFKIFSFLSSFTLAFPVKTLDTVAGDTPASFAIS